MNIFSSKGIVMSMLLLISNVAFARSGDADFSHAHRDKKKRYDYIIVGGGSAGCILARKLSDKVNGKYKHSVLVIEAGPNNLGDPIIESSDWLSNVSELTYNPKYAITYTVPAVGFAVTGYSEGRQLGGGAAHNYLLTVRGTPSIYNSWENATGNARWNYESNVRPLMTNLEHLLRNADTPQDLVERGENGVIFVSQSDAILQGDNAFFDALNAYNGTPFVADYNNPTYGDIGISAVQQYIDENNKRSYSLEAFLADVIDADGKGKDGRKLTVWTNKKVLTIRINGDKRATSVHCTAIDSNDDNDPEIIKASLTKDSGILVLAAGSVQTPTLLMRSGVGPEAVLNDANIPVIVKSEHVGQNMQNQYGSPVIISGITVPFEAELYLDGSPYMAADGVRRLQGINVTVGPNVFESIFSIMQPAARGSVVVASNNPFFEPRLTYPMFTDNVNTVGSDSYLQIAFYKIMKQAANDAGLTMEFPEAAHFPAPYGPAPDDSLLLADAQASVMLTSHIVGTAQMGTNINNGVVDGNLKVFGLKNVYIGDNSVQPHISNGNTCYPAYVIALVLAQVLGVPTPPIL